MGKQTLPRADPALLALELNKIEQLGVQRYLDLAFQTDKTHIEEYLEAHAGDDGEEDELDEAGPPPLPPRSVKASPSIPRKPLPQALGTVHEPHPPPLPPRTNLPNDARPASTVDDPSGLPPTAHALDSRLAAIRTAITPYATEATRSASTAATRWSKQTWTTTRTWATPKADVASARSKQAWEETRFWAGGLLSRPTESTRHFTILRHSPGLVYYRGPATTVAITIFASSRRAYEAGSNDRTLWLQQRGRKGAAGLAAECDKGGVAAWVDVTPAREAALADVGEGEARAWERDLARFADACRRGDDERLRAHAPRETLVVRIPATVKDGYFRFVLCATAADHHGRTRGSGKDRIRRTVLCPSPIFRLASTSSDPSKIRGASRATMPVELGVKAGAVAAKIAIGVATAQISPITMAAAEVAGAAAGPAVVTQYGGMAAGAAGNYVVRKKITRTVRGMANYEQTEEEADGGAARNAADGGDKAPAGTGRMRQWLGGVKGRVRGSVDGTQAAGDQKTSNRQFDLAKHDLFGDMDEGNEAPNDRQVASLDGGPVKPFPHIFKGKVVRGTGQLTGGLGLETANLASVPGWITGHLKGVYFGWISIIMPQNTTAEPADSSIARTQWYESIINIGPSPYTGPTIAEKAQVTVHIIREFERPFLDARLKVVVMGHLRPETYGAALATAAGREKTLLRLVESVTDDMGVTMLRLGRDSWGAEETLQRLEERKGGRKWKDKYVDTRTTVQRRVDNMPMHLAGVRTAGAQRRDAVQGNGGLWIRR